MLNLTLYLTQRNYTENSRPPLQGDFFNIEVISESQRGPKLLQCPEKWENQTLTIDIEALVVQVVDSQFGDATCHSPQLLVNLSWVQLGHLGALSIAADVVHSCAIPVLPRPEELNIMELLLVILKVCWVVSDVIKNPSK